MDKSRFQKILRRAFWVPFTFAIMLAVLLLVEVQFLMSRAAWVEHTDQVITLAQRIYRNRIDQETGLRAYVLTNDRRFLQPFYDGRQQSLVLEPQLQQLVSDNPEQTANNAKSVQAFQAWSSWADEAIAMTEAGEEDAGDVKFQLHGKALMDQYRKIRTGFLEREQQLRDQRIAQSRQSLKTVNASVVALCILLGGIFAAVGRKQLTSLSKTYDEALTVAEANASEVRTQKEWFQTTLHSIGDAVIATDADGLVTLMNSVAEELTGWPLAEARGKPLTDVFRILNQQTREPVENPVDKVRRLNRVVGLANHTILISKSGQEISIDDSGAPIFDADQMLAGVVLVFRDVTEQRALAAVAETQALETNSQRERLAGIISSAMDAIITVNEAQRIVLFNRAAEQIFRCSAAEAMGQPLGTFIPERFHQVHREHVEGFGRTGDTNRSMSRPGTLWAQRNGGEEFPIEATISQVEAGGQKLFTVVLRDVTEKRQTEAKLAEQAGLLELTSDAIIVRSESGLISYWNRGAEVLYGWTPEEAVGKVIHDLLQTQSPQPLAELVDRVRKQRHWEGELVHSCKNGESVTVLSRWVQVTGEEDTSDTRSLMEINTDITRRKQLESALQSNERLALAGRLSASIAHEIHNPLDTVGNVLFLLGEQTSQKSEIQKLITTAQNEVQRVTEISRNMLSLHRKSRDASAVNISELLEGVVMLIEETIAKGRRVIRLQHGFNGDVEGFPAELRQVFTNVIKNAVEATAEGGDIRIVSEAARESGRNGVLIHVVDNGVGVPAQLQSKLFDPFVSTKDESGTGLGLWVSRNILEEHGGTIHLSSSVEPQKRGTTVSIFLPLQAISRNRAPGSASAAHGEGS